MTIYLSENFATGFGQFQPVGNTTDPTIATAPAGRTTRALKSSLPSGGNRAEVMAHTASGPTLTFTKGQRVILKESVYLTDANFNTSAWQLMNQFKDLGSISTSPPIAIGLNGGKVRFETKSRSTSGALGPVVHFDIMTATGGWHDFVFDILLGTAGVGTASCWHRTNPTASYVQLVSNYKPPGGTFYPTLQDSTTIRVGIYHDTTNPATTIYYTNVVLASTLADVDLSGGDNPTDPPPVAAFNIVPNPPILGQTTRLDGTPSTGSTLTYAWAVTSPTTVTPGTPVLDPLIEQSQGLFLLTWNAVAGATSYEVQRSPDSFTWTTIATQAGRSVSQAGFGGRLASYFRVRAIQSGVPGPWSNERGAASRFGGLFAPEFDGGNTGNTVSWSDMADPRVKSYEVWSRPSATGTWSLAAQKTYPDVGPNNARPSPTAQEPYMYSLPFDVGERLVPPSSFSSGVYTWIVRWHLTNHTTRRIESIRNDINASLDDTRNWPRNVGILYNEVADPNDADLLVEAVNTLTNVNGQLLDSFFGHQNYTGTGVASSSTTARATLSTVGRPDGLLVWPEGSPPPTIVTHEMIGHPVFCFADMYDGAFGVTQGAVNGYVGTMKTFGAWPTDDELWWGRQVIRGNLSTGLPLGTIGDTANTTPYTQWRAWTVKRDTDRFEVGTRQTKTSVSSWPDPNAATGKEYKVRAIASDGLVGVFSEVTT